MPAASRQAVRPGSAPDPVEVHTIHLAHAEQRKREFLKRNQLCGVEFTFEDGVDGKSLDLAAIVQQGLILRGTANYTSATLGSALAHRKLWLKSAAEDRPVIVSEDDAVFRLDFRAQLDLTMRAMPRDWDILLMGYNFNSVLHLDIIPGVEEFGGLFYRRRLGCSELDRFQKNEAPTGVFPLRNCFGLPCYALSPAGARFLLARVFPLHNRPVRIPALRKTIVSFSNDSIMNCLYELMKAYVCLPPLVVTPHNIDPDDHAVTLCNVL